MRSNPSGFRARRGFVAGLAAIAAAGMLAAMPTAARAVDFSGKTVDFIIPFGTGGGSDTWARFLAPRLSQHLPGKPTVAVVNIQGAGSIKGANDFARKGTKDGLSAFGTSGSTQFPYLLGDRRVEFDYKDWQVIMASPVGGVVFLDSSLGVKSAKDLKNVLKTELKFGSQGATSLDLVPLLAYEILGMNVKPVFGMKGRGPARLAFERGEVKLDYQTTPAYLQQVVPLVQSGKAVPIMSLGMLDDDGNLVRDPTFPDLPHVGEVYEMIHGKKPSGLAWDAWMTFFAAGYPAQKMIFLKKGTPPEIVEAWRKAVAAMIAEPGFAAASAEALGDYPQAIGKKADALYKVATTVTPEARKWVIDWLKERHGAEP